MAAFSLLFPSVRHAVMGDPTKGYDTAAQGAKDAQAQLKTLSDQEWQRSQESIGKALPQFNDYKSLFDRIYGTNTAGQGMGSRMPQGFNPGTQAPQQGPSPWQKIMMTMMQGQGPGQMQGQGSPTPMAPPPLTMPGQSGQAPTSGAMTSGPQGGDLGNLYQTMMGR